MLIGRSLEDQYFSRSHMQTCTNTHQRFTALLSGPQEGLPDVQVVNLFSSYAFGAPYMLLQKE